MPPILAVGLMTGTILDGNIDIALLRTDGEEIHEFGPWRLSPYDTQLRALLADTLAEARRWNFVGPEPAIFRAAEDALTRAQSRAVGAFLKEEGVPREDVAVIGFHGQTVLHRAAQGQGRGATRQLGDGDLMARLTGIDVVYDFRSADVKAGGQGAPLAPIYHAALLRRAGAPPNSAVLNLGGVGNITWWAGADEIAAFDTGPGNAPLNDWTKRHGLGEMDRDGALAKGGRVDEARLAQWLAHPYLAAPHPKSLDRFDFSADLANGLSPRDGAATLTASPPPASARRSTFCRAGPRALLSAAAGGETQRSSRPFVRGRASRPRRRRMSAGAATPSRPNALPFSPCALCAGCH